MHLRPRRVELDVAYVVQESGPGQHRRTNNDVVATQNRFPDHAPMVSSAPAGTASSARTASARPSKETTAFGRQEWLKKAAAG